MIFCVLAINYLLIWFECMDCLLGGNSSSWSGIYNKDVINYYTTHLIEMSILDKFNQTNNNFTSYLQ